MAEPDEVHAVPAEAEQLSDEQLEEATGGMVFGEILAAGLNAAGAIALNPEPVEIGSPVGQGLVAGTG